MLSKGLKDEENKQMDKLFNDLVEVEFLPDYWEKQQRQEVDERLKDALGFGLADVMNLSSEELLLNLKEQHFSSENYEQFGDLLFRISAFEAEKEEMILIRHSIAIYEFVQLKSGTFSFSLNQKLKDAREAL
ncbi:MAG: hypothetical protein WBL27_09770, partial [Salinimicrobium sp.]